jgi:hypothetical protein
VDAVLGEYTKQGCASNPPAPSWGTTLAYVYFENERAKDEVRRFAM